MRKTLLIMALFVAGCGCRTVRGDGDRLYAAEEVCEWEIFQYQQGGAE